VEDKYTSISAPSEGLYKDRGSRFLGYAYPVSSEDEVLPLLKALSAEHHGARHVCYAYRLASFGSEPEKWRANDDGEPSGTAGRQILGQIDSLGLSNVLVAVVRYFGGVLLGVPGLIKAYRTAAAEALAAAVKVELTATASRTLVFGYAQMPAVEKILKKYGLQATNREFAEECSLDVRIPLGKMEEVAEQLEKIAIFKENLANP